MTQQAKAISTDSLMTETRRFAPSPDAAARAHIDADKYRQLYERSVKDPDGFWLEQARIDDILSPHAFVIVATWGRGDRDVHDSRVLVVTADPAIRIREDMLIEVFGRAFTMAGARAQQEWPSGPLPAGIEEDFAEWPVVMATGAQAPGGAMAFGRPPR